MLEVKTGFSTRPEQRGRPGPLGHDAQGGPGLAEPWRGTPAPGPVSVGQPIQRPKCPKAKGRLWQIVEMECKEHSDWLRTYPMRRSGSAALLEYSWFR